MPTNICIPTKLQNRLKKEEIWHARVAQLCSNVGEYLSQSPRFFPNYTIHSCEHVNDVLTHAYSLISAGSFREDLSDDTEKGLTPRDVAYLVSAILIHDLGMFLLPAGVKSMLRGEWPPRPIAECDSTTWQEEWDNYIGRAKRYTPEKKTVLFGRDIPINEACYQKDVYDDNDYLVIGEFLRQHHPRLAHEIAIYGMPGSNTRDIFENISFSPNDRKMIGLLARSHGLALRDTEACTKAHIGSGPKPRNTPVYFLMAVLRLADYLDAGQHRAPVSREHLQEIDVSISRDEWHWNQCIDKDDCQWEIGQHSRKIYATPKNSIEYIQLESWLSKVQDELDVCWAVMAEKYSDEPYRLSIHRVTCNIHDKDELKSYQEQFLTREARLRANPRILGLLIAPLYGDKPSYGIRELVQNAVDACTEREFYENEQPGGDKQYTGRVKVKIDTTKKTFTISDNGSGMNENILLNYYLSAGASYRSSDEWKQIYTRNNLPQIARSGQFGVGFLAAFLLGDTITVATRHIKDTLGYKFSFTVQSKPLCIERIRLDEPGTTISIQLKEGVLEKLLDPKHPGMIPIDDTVVPVMDFYRSWSSPFDSASRWNEWYAYDEPVVKYYVDGQELPSEKKTLSKTLDKNRDWFRLETDAFEFYLWRYAPNAHTPKFYCNGIRVYDAPERSLRKYGLALPFPQVAVSDPQAVLDIDLARSKVQTFPEEEALVKEICRYHIARLLATGWESVDDLARNLTDGFQYAGTDRWTANRFLLTPQGFQLESPDICALMSCRRYAALFYNSDSPADAISEACGIVDAGTPVSIVFSGQSVSNQAVSLSHRDPYTNALSLFLGAFVPCKRTPSMVHETGHLQAPACSNLWIAKDIYGSISQALDFALPENNPCGNAQIHAWKLNRKRCPNSGSMPINAERFDPQRFPMAVEIIPETEHAGPQATLFLRQLQELLTPAPGYPQQDMWIPYDMEDRRRKFPAAFEALASYIDRLSPNHDPE